MAERKTLLQRYGIPLNHLDFQYINQCEDARQMERIVHILQSGEEGYFPDLTKCAEEKLRVLKPNSRLFRFEEQIQRHVGPNAAEVKPIYEFSRTVRDREQRLVASATINDDDFMPPLRKIGAIRMDDKAPKNSEESTSEENDKPTAMPRALNEKRICATDYRKWDRYDPEEEILRMDLAEERIQEEVERKNRLNSFKSPTTPLITEIKEEEERIRRLSDIERDTLGEEHRMRGNEYYRAKDFDAAIAEYTRAISINPEKDAAAYNNRALTSIKQKKYSDAIRDCEKCLSIEPDNVKALYRLAESNMQSGNKEKALELFNKVLDISPDDSSNAKAFIDYLRIQIAESPPANATRLRIEDTSKATKKASKNTSKKETTVEKVAVEQQKPSPKAQVKEYDLASLVRPKEIISNKWADAAANLLNKKKSNETPPHEMKKTDFNDDNNNKEMEIRLPIFSDSNTGNKANKTLIQEL